jgi:hypothetical protein
MQNIIQALKSRTVLFAIALAVLSVLQGEQMYAGIAISVAVTVLRIVTTQPLIDK